MGLEPSTTRPARIDSVATHEVVPHCGGMVHPATHQLVRAVWARLLDFPSLRDWMVETTLVILGFMKGTDLGQETVQSQNKDD